MDSNRGELARGWYERTIKLQRHGPPPAKRLKQDDDDGKLPNDSGSSSDDDGDNDKFGPVLPGQAPRNEVSGPAVPSTDDLEIQRSGAAPPPLPSNQLGTDIRQRTRPT